MFINEATFQFAALREVERNIETSTGRAPLFATQRRERQEGWDVKLEYQRGRFLFLQFKRGKRRKRRTPKEPHDLNPEFFQFGLRWQPSDQHNKLFQLAGRGYEVFYVAPLFDDEAELHELFGRSEVQGASICVSLADLSPIAENGHRIVYDDRPVARFCSTPREVRVESLGELIRRFSVTIWTADQTVSRKVEKLARDTENILGVSRTQRLESLGYPTIEVMAQSDDAGYRQIGNRTRREKLRETEAMEALRWSASALRAELGVETILMLRPGP